MPYSKFNFILSVLLFFALTVVSNGQSPVQNPASPLKLNVPIEGQIAEGGTQSFALHLESNQFAVLVLEQKDAELEIIVDDAKNSESLIGINVNGSNFGYERVLFQSDAAPRDLLVKVNRIKNNYGKGSFKLTLTELKTADANDKIRIAAQNSFLEGIKVRQKNREQSRVIYEEALKLAREGGDKTLEVSILISLQSIEEYKGDFKKAIEYGNVALTLLIGQENSYAYAKVKQAVGFDAVSMGEVKKGVEILLEIIDKTKEIGDRELEALTLNTLSYGYLLLGDYFRSIEFARQSYEIAKNTDDKTTQNSALLNLSYAYNFQGDFFASIENLKTALPVAQESGNLGSLSRIYNQLGVNYLALGQIQKALDYHLQALSLRIKSGEKYGEATVLVSVANDYIIMGQNLRALEYNRQALQIFSELGNKESTTRGLMTTGSIYLSLKDFTKAKEAFAEALKLAENGNVRPQAAILYNSLGLTESKLNNYQAAVEYFQKAVQIRRELKLKRQEATSLSAMADNYILLEQFEKAAEASGNSLKISRAIGDQILQSNSLYNLARIKRSQKDLVASLGFIEESIKIVESLRADLISQENRAAYFSTVRYKYDFYIDLLVELEKQSGDKKYTAEAFAASERARARGLLDLLAESYTDVSSGIIPELKTREQGIGAKLSALQVKLISLKSAEKPNTASIANLQKDIDQTDGEREHLESEIRRTNPRYAELKYPTTLNLAQTQGLLDDQTVLLEYQTGVNASFLFAVSKNDFQIVRLPKEQNLRESVESLRRSISVPTRTGFANYLVTGRELYQTLLAPIENLLKTKTKIIVAADGSLNYLPFEVLLKNNTNTSLDKLPYLVRDVEISYTPSASVLATLGSQENASNAKPAKSFLAFAAPDYGAKATQQSQLVSQNTRSVFGENRNWDLTDLPNAAVEAQKISKLFPAGQSMVFSGAQATEEQAKTTELLSQYRYLHFAVHGLIDEEQPQFSSLVLTLPKADAQSATQSSQSTENPKSAEDGLLQTPEIFNLRLRADLVTLSACETGLGKEMRGEGIVGLTRAFFYAGTPSVLVSLWKVNDASTADLMTQFYEQLRRDDGRNKAAALRQAQLKLIAGNRYAHPYYWAAFVLQGKPNSLFGEK